MLYSATKDKFTMPKPKLSEEERKIKKKEYHRNYRLTHPDKWRNAANKFYRQNKKQIIDARKRERHEHPEIIKRRNHARRVKQRIQIFTHYGMFCKCCGENHFEFLTVHHINGGGNKHRKQIGSGNLYWWIIKNNYPKEFQTLCQNCNLSKGAFGYCPHEKESKC